MDGNEELKNQLTQTLADCQSKLELISTISNNATQKEAELNQLKDKIIELKSLSETEKGSITNLVLDSQNLKGQIDGHVKTATEQLNSLIYKSQEIDSHYNGFINKPNENEPSRLEKLNTTFQKILESGENAEKINAKIREAETNIFGDEKANIKGIKQLIDTYENDIKLKKQGWEEGFTTLFNKIEGLLPGATATGLSKAYQDQREKYFWPYIIWSSAFTLVAGGMIWFAISTLSEAKDLSDAFIKILAKAPFFVPAIWLAVFTSKQQSQSRRLQEEYAYKETLAKSYESYKREIEKLPDGAEKNEILKKLIDAMVDMAKYNPSQTLQLKNHNDRPPLIQGLFNKRNIKPEENK